MPFCTICGREVYALDSQNRCAYCNTVEEPAKLDMEKVEELNMEFIKQPVWRKPKKISDFLVWLPIMAVIVALIFAIFALVKYTNDPIRSLKQEAKRGYAQAQNDLGSRYYFGEDVEEDEEEAVKWYFLAAKQGHANAQNSLGWCYAKGQGITQDSKEAVKWFRKAAMQGHANAQTNLGLAYKEGDGVWIDREKAVELFRLSAMQGNARGQYFLGLSYYKGEGVRKNYGEAYFWFLVSSANGIEESKNYQNDAWITAYVSPQQRSQIEYSARRWFEQNSK